MWPTVSKTSIWYVEKTSARRKGDIVSVWVDIEKFAQDTRVASVVYRTSAKQKMNIDCANNQLQTASTTNYSATGEVTSSSSRPAAFEEIVPDSVGEVVRDLVCAKTFPAAMPKTADFVLVPNLPKSDADNLFTNEPFLKNFGYPAGVVLK
jgi:hypothetical protein